MQRRKFLLTTAAALPLAATQISGAAAPAQRSKGFLVKARASRLGEKTVLGTSPNDLKVAAEDTGAALSIFEYTGHDRGGPPLHVHFAQDEIFYVLEGEYLFQVGTEQFRATAGDTVFAPRQVPHAFAQVSAQGRMFYLFQPAGMMEDFFRQAGAPAKPGGPDLFATHNMKVVGLPLTY